MSQFKEKFSTDLDTAGPQKWYPGLGLPHILLHLLQSTDCSMQHERRVWIYVIEERSDTKKGLEGRLIAWSRAIQTCFYLHKNTLRDLLCFESNSLTRKGDMLLVF